MEDQIIKLYQEGKTLAEIEKSLNVHWGKISKVLLKAGIDYKAEAAKKEEKKKALAIKMYEEGANTPEICKLLGISKNTLRPLLKEAGVVIRSQSQSLRNTNIKGGEELKIKKSKERIKFKVRDSAFDNIHDEEAAYWIGFLYSDGHIRKESFTISIGLKQDDRKHLYKLCDFLNLDKTQVRCYPSNNSCQVVFTSSEIYRKLQSLGFTNRKSWNAAPPKELELNRNFWRGVVDGDGTLGSYNRSYISVKGEERIYSKNVIGVCGTPATCNKFREFLISAGLDIDHIDIKVQSETFATIVISNNQNTKFISNILYKNANVYLDRKYEIYKQIQNGGLE